jgi:hypothetical protein
VPGTGKKNASSAGRRSTKEGNRLIAGSILLSIKRSSGGRGILWIAGTNQAHFSVCTTLRGILHVEAWQKAERIRV